LEYPALIVYQDNRLLNIILGRNFFYGLGLNFQYGFFKEVSTKSLGAIWEVTDKTIMAINKNKPRYIVNFSFLRQW
jgi:hypothetical protein